MTPPPARNDQHRTARTSQRGRSTTTPPAALEWTDLDKQAVNVIRGLAMDAVEASGSGHPGTAMSLAPAAYLLFQRHLRQDPSDPSWVGRDRFVLSCGHSSLTLYCQLFLSGYGLTVEDIAHLRQWESLTPAHPEHGHTPGVESTTGPLGQGVGNAVGMAMASRRQRGLLDPDAAPGTSPFDHHIWCFASDGDLEEGVSAEVSSLADTQQLGNLSLMWDDNHISIEDNTQIACVPAVQVSRRQRPGTPVPTPPRRPAACSSGCGARRERAGERPVVLVGLDAAGPTGRVGRDARAPRAR